MDVRKLITIVGLLLLPADAALLTENAAGLAEGFSPVITPAPEHIHIGEKRDGANDLIGYFSYSDQWVVWTCPSGESYATHSGFGGCCEDNKPTCDYGTACVDGSKVAHMGGGTGTCNPGHMCDTITVSRSQDVADGVNSLLWCIPATEWNNIPRVFYRNTHTLNPTVTATVTETETMGEATVTEIVNEDAGHKSQSPKEVTAVLMFCISLVFTTFYGF